MVIFLDFSSVQDIKITVDFHTLLAASQLAQLGYIYTCLSYTYITKYIYKQLKRFPTCNTLTDQFKHTHTFHTYAYKKYFLKKKQSLLKISKCLFTECPYIHLSKRYGEKSDFLGCYSRKTSYFWEDLQCQWRTWCIGLLVCQSGYIHINMYLHICISKSITTIGPKHSCLSLNIVAALLTDIFVPRCYVTFPLTWLRNQSIIFAVYFNIIVSYHHYIICNNFNKQVSNIFYCHVPSYL